MKISRLFILFFILIGFSLYSQNETSLKKLVHSNSKLIGSNDSIIFNLSTATVTANYIDIPVYIKSDEIINAVDFAFKFNETKLAFDSLINLKGYLSALSHFNLIDRHLRFTSSSLQTIQNNTSLVVLRFNFLVPCTQINVADFFNVEAYLNGDVCKYKFTEPFYYLPTANFTYSLACSGGNNSFLDSSYIQGASITSWKWNFGNLSTSVLQNPNLITFTVGTHDVSLLVTSSNGCKDSIQKNITVNESPISSFTYTFDCVNDSVYFANTSTIHLGNIMSSSWNFGDLNSANIADPTHHYNSGGSFIVSLSSISDLGCTQTSTLLISLNKPTSDFLILNSNCTNLVINFSNTSTYTVGTIVSSNWLFGDGNTSSLINPSNTFTAAGTYSVTLFSTSNLGCKGVTTKTIEIVDKPVVNFTALNTVGCPNLTVGFSNTSLSNINYTYLWSFGDGNSSLLYNTSHTYSVSGIYDVKQVVTLPGGCSDSLIKSSFIEIYSSPTVSFSFSNACVNSLVNFTNSSTVSSGTITSYFWQYGDGVTGNLEQATHSYTTANNYTVNLICENNFGCKDSLSKIISIANKPVVDFSLSSTSGCAPLTISFIDLSSTSSIATYAWNFGNDSTSIIQNPSIQFLNSGQYNIKQVVTTNSGCKDSIIKLNAVTVYDLPIASFNSGIGGCVNSIFNFTDNSSTANGTINTWNWNFGNGNSSTSQNPTAIFTSASNYSISLTVTSNKGCSNTINKTFLIDDKPVVKFGADRITGCAPLIVTFIDSSITANNSNYYWDFGNSTSTVTKNGITTYSTNGFYTIKHIVTTLSGCKDSLTKANYIDIKNPPVAFFTPSQTTAIIPNASISFSNLSSGFNSSLWDFGDNNLSTLNSPAHTFADTGSFKVCLDVSSINACISKYCTNVFITAPNNIGIPSAFSPNNDGFNDEFKINGGPFLEIELNIFNEWGNLIFSSTSQEEGWNGFFKNKPQPIGVYEYTVKGKTMDNKDVNYYGVVNLSR